ncbi:unnamed protein product [Eretmochelys imbricata]
MEPDKPYNGGPAPGAHSGSSVAIIGAEDEDFENDIEPTLEDQSSPFQSMCLVKQHPAYLMAFLHHVVLQFDSCPVVSAGGWASAPYTPAGGDRSLTSWSKRMMGMTPGEQELAELESYHTRDRGIHEAKEKQVAELAAGPAGRDAPHDLRRRGKKAPRFSPPSVTYMKHLGVKTKLGESKKSKGNFFRKKISGSRRPEEPPKPRKGFSLLDATRWNRGESHNSEFRQSKVPEAEKAAAPERKGLKLLERSESRAKGAASGTPGLDPPGVSVTVNPPPEEGTDGELGLEPQYPVEPGGGPPQRAAPGGQC